MGYTTINMKILLSKFCNHCLEEAQQKNEKYDLDHRENVLVELNDEGVYSFNCPKNHTQWVFTFEEIFQILYDLGVRSLCDGYTREAVASFATSLERYYEYIIKLFLLSEDVNDETLENYWNIILKQSERQYGAYLSLYCNKTKKPPNIQSNKWVEFRNKIIHYGHIPSEIKTLEYAQYIYDLIFSGLAELIEIFPDNYRALINNVTRFRIRILEKKYPGINKAGSRSAPTIIQTRTIGGNLFKKVNIVEEVAKYRSSDRLLKIMYKN